MPVQIVSGGIHLMIAALELGPVVKHRTRARELLDSALSLDPGHPGARLYNARFFLFEEDLDYQSALNELDYLARMCPTHHENSLFYSTVLQRLKQYDRAIRIYDHGLEANPFSGLLHSNRGMALFFSGRFERAFYQ